MQAMVLKKGTVLQLNPETVKNKAFTACFLIVTECKDWGVQGYVQALGTTRDAPGGLAYYRATWDEVEVCGCAVWVANTENLNFEEQE